MSKTFQEIVELLKARLKSRQDEIAMYQKHGVTHNNPGFVRLEQIAQEIEDIIKDVEE
jgi:hypothetical protein